MVSAAITLRLTRRAPIAHVAVITGGALTTLTAAVAVCGLDRARTAALIGVVALLTTLAAPRLTVVLAKMRRRVGESGYWQLLGLVAMIWAGSVLVTRMLVT